MKVWKLSTGVVLALACVCLAVLPRCVKEKAIKEVGLPSLAPSEDEGRLYLYLSSQSSSHPNAALLVKLFTKEGNRGWQLWRETLPVGNWPARKHHYWIRLRFDVPLGDYTLVVEEEKTGAVALNYIQVGDSDIGFAVQFWFDEKNAYSTRPFITIRRLKNPVRGPLIL